jgi:hypothetical protein
MSESLRKAQEQILKVVASSDSDVYLVGGTALAMRYQHRYSEDLDFFTQRWTKTLHRTLAKRITAATGFPARLIAEQRKPGQAGVAFYNFRITAKDLLKVDVIEDFDRLLQPIGSDWIASLDDIYLRKLRAVIGWRGKRSSTGQELTGGRQEAKDLYDLWHLSTHYAPLHEWFPAHFGREDYARLTRWLQAMTRQETTFALLDIAPGCDAKRIVRHLEDQVYDRLNRVYVPR